MFDPDAPWWANTLLLFAVLVVVPWWMNRRGTKKVGAKLDRVAADVAATRTQTENEHHDAEFPNLRDEVTEVRGLAQRAVAAAERAGDAAVAIREDVGGVHSELRDVRSDIAGVRTDARRDRRAVTQVREDMNGFMRGREAAIDSLRDQIPELVADALTQHVHDCPLRPEGKEPTP